MNLALITQDFPPELGGIQTYASELSKRFARKCDNFLVIAPDKQNAADVDKHLPFPVYRINTTNPLLGVMAMPQVPGIVSEHGIRNVFHAQWQTLPASFIAQKLGKVDHIYSAVHARELVFNPFDAIPILSSVYDVYKNYMLSKPDFLFPVSDFMSRLLQEHGVEKDRMQTIINGTDPTRFKPTNTQVARTTLGIEAQNVLLSVSRLISKKGVDTTIKAFTEVLEEYPDSCYVIVGDGEQKNELKSLTNKLGISESVQFVGSVSHKSPKLVDYYNACDIFVQPSKTERENIEGCPIVFMEANGCAKPVIGSNSSGIPSAIEDGETGILVEERNPKALGSAIKKLFSDKELAKNMGIAGRKRVQETANWDVVSQRIWSIINEN